LPSKQRSQPLRARELRFAGDWALMGKFDGEFGRGTQTYVGTGRVRYV